MQNSSNSLPMIVVDFADAGIEGDSQLEGYKNKVDAWHFQHGMNMQMVADKSSNSRTSGRAQHDDFTFWMPMCKAYPKLIAACASGKNLGKVLVRMVKMSEGTMQDVAVFTLTQAYVSNIGIRNISETPLKDAAPASGGGAVVEFSLNYQSMDSTYNAFDSSGSNQGAVSSSTITGI